MSGSEKTRNTGGRVKKSASGKTTTPSSQAARTPPSSASIKWDDSKMVTSFADVVNLQSTREQMCLFFGMNQSWTAGEDPDRKPVQVELKSRIILSPHAAKRLSLALSDIIEKYESKFGELKL